MARLRRYGTDDIVVSFDASRCIHAAECVLGLPSVFNVESRPWIRPEAATPDAIMEVVARCPTGALRATRVDGGPEEEADPEASIRMVENGPLHLRGEIEVVDADGNAVVTGTRLALCRCGASRNKPFCDNSHKKSGFKG